MSGRGKAQRKRKANPTAAPQPTRRRTEEASTWWESENQPEVPSAHNVEAEETVSVTETAGTLSALMDRMRMLEGLMAVKGDLIDPLSIAVTPEMREKIGEGKFVDLADLLNKTLKVPEVNKRLTCTEDEHGNLSFKAVRPTKATLSIDQWTSAFHTYMSVYLEAHPEALQGMLAYLELIRGAARDHPSSFAWRQYDEQFRSKKAADPIRPWGMIDNQLWLSLFCRPPAPAAQASHSATEYTKLPNNKKECFYFNGKLGCRRENCKFSHNCSKCGSPTHAAHNCYASSRQAQPTSHTETTTPGPKEPNTNGKRPFRFGKAQ